MTVTFASTIEKHCGDVVIEHTHVCNEVIYYDEGCFGTGHIGDYEYEFTGGCVTMIPQGASHTESHCGNGRVIYFGFTDENKFSAVCHSNLSYMKRYFRDIIFEVCNQSFGYEEMLELTLRKILLHLHRTEFVACCSATNFNYCRKYIEENFTQPLSLKDLAATSGYSYDYFRHLFTAVYGQSPYSLIISLRLELAAKLLKTTSISCTEIAHQCGFFDSGQMSKMIKKKFGMSPLELRKK